MLLKCIFVLNFIAFVLSTPGEPPLSSGNTANLATNFESCLTQTMRFFHLPVAETTAAPELVTLKSDMLVRSVNHNKGNVMAPGATAAPKEYMSARIAVKLSGACGADVKTELESILPITDTDLVFENKILDLSFGSANISAALEAAVDAGMDTINLASCLSNVTYECPKNGTTFFDSSSASTLVRTPSFVISLTALVFGSLMGAPRALLFAALLLVMALAMAPRHTTQCEAQSEVCYAFTEVYFYRDQGCESSKHVFLKVDSPKIVTDLASEKTSDGYLQSLECATCPPVAMAGRPFHNDEGKSVVATQRTFDCDESTRSGEETQALRDAYSWQHDRVRATVTPVKRNATLVDEWVQRALAEHASVASFSHFSMQLMAVGAPADLIRDAHRAALDEIEHARLSFGVAARHTDKQVAAPGPFSSSVTVTVKPSLVEMVRATAQEGCLSETISTLEAAIDAEHETDVTARRVLLQIVADEARHAALAWKTVRWALARDEVDQKEAADVRAAVHAELDERVVKANIAQRLDGVSDAVVRRIERVMSELLRWALSADKSIVPTFVDEQSSDVDALEMAIKKMQEAF